MKSNPKRRRIVDVGRAIFLLVSLGLAPPLQAAEFGIGGYFLGLTTPLAGYTPPPGLYFNDTFFLYHGSFGPSDQRTTYNILADINIVAWYPDWDFFGASPGFSAVVPYVGVRNKFQSATTDPDGSRQVSGSTDTANSIGDTEYSAILGWTAGEHHWNVMVTGFMPTGHFTPYQLSITGLNRPEIDFRGAYTYLGLQTGFELSAALGMSVNALNTATNYLSGTEMHFEWALQQHFPFGLYAGVTGYIYQQVTDDTGAGATNGPYRGRAFAIGPSIGYTFKVDGQELNLSARWYHEFAVVNRPLGDSIFASLGFRF